MANSRRDNTRRIKRLYALALTIGLVTLALLLWQAYDPGSDQTVTESPTAIEYPVYITQAEVSIPPTQTLAPSEATVAYSMSETPADNWAEAVLLLASRQLATADFAVDGLAWWQAEDRRGLLDSDGQRVFLNDVVINIPSNVQLEIQSPDPDSPDQLILLGRVYSENGVLTLSSTAPSASRPGGQWMVSSTDIMVALHALVTVANTQDQTLEVALAQDEDGTVVRLVIVGVRAADESVPTSTPTPLNATLSPTLTFTPTPTRVPEAYMGQLIEGILAPVVQDLEKIEPRTVEQIIESHPWAGTLVWAEEGPVVNGRPTAIKSANELTLYYIAEDGEELVTRQFFSAIYEFETTRFPDQQVFFQQHRMDEILLWLIRYADSQGYQLIVTYDDFGSRQALTLTGMRPLDETPHDS